MYRCKDMCILAANTDILLDAVPPYVSMTSAGEAGEAIALAPPDSCVAMEASVAGLPSDALKAIDDIGTIDRLDDSSLAVRSTYCWQFGSSKLKSSRCNSCFGPNHFTASA